MVFLDIQVAYDSVDRSLLCESLRHSNLDPRPINTIQNLYDKSTTQIIVGQTTTATVNAQAGVQQGSALSHFEQNSTSDFAASFLV